MLNNPNPFTDKLLADLYADNLVTGTHTILDAVHLYQSAKQLFAQIGMNMRKWTSNNDELLDAIPIADRYSALIISLFGLSWNTQADMLLVKRPTMIPEPEPTKHTAAVYDPLGFFSPTVLQAKFLIQHLWEENFDWDTKLPEPLCIRWSAVRIELDKLSSIPLPRYIGSTKGSIHQLHCFVDASARAYAAVVYLRVTDENSNLPPKITLLFSKTRLATPVKKGSLSIPKLELLAAVLGSRNAKFVENSLTNLKLSEKFLWSDSRCVVSWIHSSRILPTFIERRVREIKQTNIEVRHVPGNQNPADIASRGSNVHDLNTSSWWTGPDFLHQSPDTSPKEHVLIDDTENQNSLVKNSPTLEPVNVLVNTTKPVSPPLSISVTDYSSLQ